MTTDVEVGDLEPEVKVDVVLLAPLERFVVFTARPRHDQELVVEAADGVTVTRVLHLVHGEAIEQVRVVVHDLVALLQRGGLSLDVATADQEDLVTRCLDVCEVVLE